MSVLERRTWAKIDLDIFKSNLKHIRDFTDSELLIPIKADAYGHGSCELARIAGESGVEYLGVAGIDEAIELREYGIKIPIVILSPVFDFDIEDIVYYGIIPTVSDIDFAEKLNNFLNKKLKSIDIFVEVDTGMGRTGFLYNKAYVGIKRIKEQFRNLRIKSIFSHFSTAEDENDDFAVTQMTKFKELKRKLFQSGLTEVKFHISNSAGMVRFNDPEMKIVRPGILAYGLYTSESMRKYIDVQPIMSVYSRISRIANLNKGDSVSYGRKILDRSLKVATINIGYGDGYPRCLSDKGYVLIKGRKCKIIGNVCMDLTIVDISGIDNVEVGDIVTIINGEITAEDLAKQCDTINYEIITRIGERVSRIYYENGKPIKIRTIASRKIHKKL
ncbi:MAG: alanine racemase [Proteobacteria bacterium]|nr:alanine racemase [Pseudomonadota bacterium]